jgi:bisphosphoglycerate-independent phosphoglycerate mutase (AlkP superfamily)
MLRRLRIERRICSCLHWVATLIQNLEKIHSGSRKLYQNTSVQLASIIGRYYAMDRDKRWERIKLAYDLLVNGQGTHSKMQWPLWKKVMQIM